MMTNTISAIQNAISNGTIDRYASSADFWANIADASAVFVIIGIFAEVLELTPKVLKAVLELNCSFVVKRKAVIQSSLDWSDKYKHRIELCGFIFWMVIIIALLGEVVVTRIGRHFDSFDTVHSTKQSKLATK